jgi:integrase
MNTQSQIKVFSSSGYDYLYIYFKLGKNMLRIPTEQTLVEGKMTKEMLFSAKVEDYETKNKKIIEIKSKVDDYLSVKLKEHYPTISQKECKKFIQERYMRGDLFSGKRYEPLKPVVENKSLVNYIEDYIEYRKSKNTRRNTAKEFTTMLNRVKAFDLHNKQTTYLNDINFTWSDKFEEYLNNKAKNGKDENDKDKYGYDSGTVEKTYTILITVLYHFYSRKDEQNIELSDKFTLAGFKRGAKSRNLANPLTFEQFQVLFKHKFDEEYLELTRIRFCLQCSTGLRFGDIHRITEENIDNDRIVIEPAKTAHLNKIIYIDLNIFSKSILEQLHYNTYALKIENAPYNRNIKTMFKKMQIKKPELKFRDDYGSHCGRDTFISICVQKGVDFKTILLWTGQTSYTVMDRYIFATDEYKAGQMKKAFN